MKFIRKFLTYFSISFFSFISIKGNIKFNIYSFHKVTYIDKERFYECEALSFGKLLQPHPSMHFFDSSYKTNSYTGITISNGFPLLLWFYNINNYNRNNYIFVGLRGLSLGIHVINLTTELQKAIDKDFKKSILFVPDSYIDIGRNRIKVACHGNRSIEYGQELNFSWRGFDDYGFWYIFDKIFDNDWKIILVSFSNGTVPRHQIIKDRIVYGMVDIEGNYDKDNLDTLVNYFRHNSGPYYALCGSKFCARNNHFFLVKELNLIRMAYDKDFDIETYSNGDNITIDIVGDNPILTHNSAIGYAMNKLKRIFKE